MTGIMTFSEDLNNAQAPAPLPLGRYPGEIVSAAEKVSQTSGNTYANIQFRIQAASYPADFTDGDPDGITLSYNRLLMEDTPQARWRWRKFLEAVGGRLSRQIDLTELLGLTGILDITHDTYEGEKRAQIARVMQT